MLYPLKLMLCSNLTGLIFCMFQVQGASLTEQQKLLTEPLVVRDVSRGCWTISYEYVDERGLSDLTPGISGTLPPAQQRIRTVDVAKAGGVTHEHMTNGSGKAFDRIWVDKVLYWKRGSELMWDRHETNPHATPEQAALDSQFQEIGFPDTEWVSRECYAGLVTVAKRQCLVYVSNGELDVSSGDILAQIRRLPSPARSVLVDIKTKLPILILNAQGTLAHYELQDPPKGEIKLPEDLSQQLRDREKTNEIMSGPKY